MSYLRFVRALFPLFLLTVLLGCNAGPQTNPLPQGEASSTPSIVPTATLAPTFTVQPSATATVPPSATPTATFTPEPSATPEPTATLTPTFTPEPSPTPTPAFPDFLTNPPERGPSAGRVTQGKTYPPGAYEFIHDQFTVPAPPGRVPNEYVATRPGVEAGQCPLSGLPAPDDIATRRPINVRIDNSPQGRPQAGLENADVVWETLAEGGVTRFTVTFHCNTPGTVGPIRSARLIDMHLTPMLGAWLVHVGASQPVTDMIWSSPFAGRDIDEWKGDPAFYRIERAPVGWLRTYSNGDLIQRTIAERTDVPPPTPLRGWTFSDAPPAGSTGTATAINIPYPSPVNYAYDTASQRYFRYQGQSAHVTQGGTHLAADNVIVLYSDMTVTPIVEDSLGNLSLHFDLQGRGDALLFRDGIVWETQWVREGENTLVRVVDANGQPIPLSPGQTWVQIVPSDSTVTWQQP